MSELNFSPITMSQSGRRRVVACLIATLAIVATADLATIPATQQFCAYGPSHLAVLVVFAIGSAALVWTGHRQTEPQARHFGRVLGVAIMAIFGVALAYKLVQPTIAQSVPLQLCDIAELTAAYALWSQHTWAATLVYYWGLPLSSQALITPDLNAADFPSHSFLTFFALHLLVVWAAIYLTWGYGIRPGWRNYRFAILTTLAWGAFTLVFNTIAGTDYGFLNRKPANASALDFLGPWPFYVLAEVAIVGAIWALMTWPWERKAVDRAPQEPRNVLA
ncbi:putative integral membrane protein [Mycobacterium lentiflavum]|uniref:Putative integral membrane protein n=1 Tax=Mycobacterium lentiflavum TaxID=141349 RepID=A0A0E4GX44_MYCLN|nr:putative integral membrane protein [Mycobacterium lentiflavum]